MFNWLKAVAMIFDAVFRGIRRYLPVALPVVEYVAAETRNRTLEEVAAFLRRHGIEPDEELPAKEYRDGLLLALAAKLIGIELGRRGVDRARFSNTRPRSLAQIAYDVHRQREEA